MSSSEWHNVQACEAQIKLCAMVTGGALSLGRVRRSAPLSEVTLREAWWLSPKAGIAVSLQGRAEMTTPQQCDCCHSSRGLLAA